MTNLKKSRCLMNLRTEQTLGMTKFVTWVVFIGLIMQFGAILISYFVSLSNPEASKDLYQGLDYSYLYSKSELYYSIIIFLNLAQILLKIIVGYFVIRIFKILKIENPFSYEISKLIEKVSYIIIALWVLTWLTNTFSLWLAENDLTIEINSNSLSFILLAGVLYIFSQIFKRGVELQSENEMTV